MGVWRGKGVQQLIHRPFISACAVYPCFIAYLRPSDGVGAQSFAAYTRAPPRELHPMGSCKYPGGTVKEEPLRGDCKQGTCCTID